MIAEHRQAGKEILEQQKFLIWLEETRKSIRGNNVVFPVQRRNHDAIIESDRLAEAFPNMSAFHTAADLADVMAEHLENIPEQSDFDPAARCYELHHKSPPCLLPLLVRAPAWDWQHGPDAFYGRLPELLSSTDRDVGTLPAIEISLKRELLALLPKSDIEANPSNVYLRHFHEYIF